MFEDILGPVKTGEVELTPTPIASVEEVAEEEEDLGLEAPDLLEPKP